MPSIPKLDAIRVETQLNLLVNEAAWHCVIVLLDGKNAVALDDRILCREDGKERLGKRLELLSILGDLGRSLLVARCDALAQELLPLLKVFEAATSTQHQSLIDVIFQVTMR